MWVELNTGNYGSQFSTVVSYDSISTKVTSSTFFLVQCVIDHRRSLQHTYLVEMHRSFCSSSLFLILSALFTASAFTVRNSNNHAGRSSVTFLNSVKFNSIADLSVCATDGKKTTLGAFAPDNEKFIISFLSHFGDFNAWELTQQYQAAVKVDQQLALQDNCSVGRNWKRRSSIQIR